MNTIQAGNPSTWGSGQAFEEDIDGNQDAATMADEVSGMDVGKWEDGEVPGDLRGSFEALDVAGGEQCPHLGDGDVVEGGETFRLWQALADEDGVEAFEVGEDYELFERSVVTDIAFGGGVGVAPLFGGLAEEGDVEQIRLAGINRASLGLGDGRRDEGVLDGVGVDAVVDLGEGALEVPIELEAVVFLVLKVAKFPDQVNFELGADPNGTVLSENPLKFFEIGLARNPAVRLVRV